MDKEKVISNLQVVHNYLKSFENTAKMGEWVGDALSMLKEQETVKPKVDAFGHPYCPKCKILVYETWEFCPHCGQAVKWE